MNTSLQCISNCWELTNYFLKNHYKKDINTQNPIGCKGILAREFANLLKHMWYGEKNVASPWNFKRAISKFQPMVIIKNITSLVFWISTT
jgi:ubiquitin carboxyl-terminal hydrolase 4/11/15